MSRKWPEPTIKLDLSTLPSYKVHRLAAATIEAALKTKREDPEMWAKIEARAAEIRAGKAPEYLPYLKEEDLDPEVFNALQNPKMEKAMQSERTDAG